MYVVERTCSVSYRIVLILVETKNDGHEDRKEHKELSANRKTNRVLRMYGLGKKRGEDEPKGKKGDDVSH